MTIQLHWLSTPFPEGGNCTYYHRRPGWDTGAEVPLIYALAQFKAESVCCVIAGSIGHHASDDIVGQDRYYRDLHGAAAAGAHSGPVCSATRSARRRQLSSLGADHFSLRAGIAGDSDPVTLAMGVRGDSGTHQTASSEWSG